MALFVKWYEFDYAVQDEGTANWLSSERNSPNERARWYERGPFVTVVHALDDLRDVFSEPHSRAAWYVVELAP